MPIYSGLMVQRIMDAVVVDGKHQLVIILGDKIQLSPKRKAVRRISDRGVIEPECLRSPWHLEVGNSSYSNWPGYGSYVP